MLIRPYVSKLAIVRYVQVVLHVAPPISDSASMAKQADMAARAAGRSGASEIAREILSPAVRTAILAGFPLVATRRFRAIVAPNGTIKTIIDPYPRTNCRLMIKTDTEMDRRWRRNVRCSRDRQRSASCQ